VPQAAPSPALVAAYREGLALAAVAVIAGPGGARVVVAEQVVNSDGETLHARWWCRGAAAAECVAAHAAARLRRKRKNGAYAISLAYESIAAAARRFAVLLLSDAEIETDAIELIARLDAELAKQQRAGALKSVNASYRNYRLAASARGEPVLRYAQWMERYRANLIREAARNLRRG